MSDKRLIKTPLSASLIRRMDEALVAGLGGFTTRPEFIAEAIDNLLLELTFSDEDQPQPPAVVVAAEPAKLDSTQPERSRDSLTVRSTPADTSTFAFSETVIRSPSSAVVIDYGIASIDRGHLMFGLHNRDFPSIWAASRLASRTEHQPVPWRSFLDTTTAEAWQMSRGLAQLESSGFKLNALFPGNEDKRQSSERGFQNFAIGSVGKSVKTDHSLAVDGPLFIWDMCQVVLEDDGPLVALTPSGLSLLTDLAGLDAAVPHQPVHFDRFMAHLVTHSPGDARGFVCLLESVSKAPNRQQLINNFRDELGPEASETYANTVAQGYVARGREWGLVDVRLAGGRYALTSFGEERLTMQDQPK